jgi:CHASE3 domain sensor protein
VRKHVSKLALLALVLFVATPGFAGMVPSKTAENQSLDSRQADLAVIEQAISTDQVAQALAAQGYTQDEISTRLAALSNEDLASLAQNIEHIQAAGVTTQQWTYILIGAVIVLIILLA